MNENKFCILEDIAKDKSNSNTNKKIFIELFEFYVQYDQ